MVAPRSMVSLRLSDEELAGIDQRVGLDGQRSRSDVIRTAVEHYLEATPQSPTPGVERVTLEIGLQTKHMLGMLHQNFGYGAPEAFHVALSHFMQTYVEQHQQMLAQWDGLRQPGYEGREDQTP